MTAQSESATTEASSISTELSVSSKKLAPLMEYDMKKPNTSIATRQEVDSIDQSPMFQSKSQPVLGIRGCTPAEHSTLDNTLYVIDVGQHTVRNGGEVEWEITIECNFNLGSVSSNSESGRGDTLKTSGSGKSIASQDSIIEYRIRLADTNARSWLQLSRGAGSVERNRCYQNVVLYFLRDIVGVFSTFVILENLNNPADIKLIRVKLEVIADLNSLRAMSASSDVAANLFRVHVSCYSGSKRQRRKSLEAGYALDVPGRLEIEYGDVFYEKLYHNHSIVLENFSSLSLDFMLSSNARPHEVGFSISPTSFNEISSVTLAAHARLQVFLNFRPAPKVLATDSQIIHENKSWVRDIEVYVNCRLVKDFRETVLLKAICNYPQMHVHIALNKPNIDEPALPYYPAQPSFLGMGFSAPESFLCDDGEMPTTPETGKYLVMKNSKSDSNAHVALRNDSMFFDVSVDHILTDDGEIVSKSEMIKLVEISDNGVSGSRSSTLTVKLEPQYTAIFLVQPNFILLRKNRQQWEHSVKEHVAFYNMKQFAEHYHVSLNFTPR